MQHKNLTRFYYKNEIKIEQIYDKKMYPKLMLNILKVMGILPLFNSMNFFKKLLIYMWPMFTHVHISVPMCGPCPPMCEL